MYNFNCTKITKMNKSIIWHNYKPKRVKGARKTTKMFVESSKAVHGNLYDYSKVNYVNNREKVDIVCKAHGVTFWQTPRAHLSGYGCPACRVELPVKMTREDFLTQAVWKHGDKYDYSKVVFIDQRIPVVIKC